MRAFENEVMPASFIFPEYQINFGSSFPLSISSVLPWMPFVYVPNPMSFPENC